MWSIIGVLAAAGIIALIEIPSLLKKKLKRELWTFSILLLFGTGLSIALGLQVEIPNPIDWIIAVHKLMSDFIFSLLK